MGVKVDQYPGLPGMMFAEEEPPRIEVAEFDDTPYVNYGGSYPSDPQTKYIAALHELGHVAFGHTQGRPPHEDKKFYFENGVIKSEAQAWYFAFENCVDEVREVSKNFALRCFDSYRITAVMMGNAPGQRLRNGNRHYVAFSYDSPYTPYITNLLGYLKGENSLLSKIS